MEKEEIIKKANEIFERTKNEQEKYQYERQIIYKLMNSSDAIDLEILENMIKLCEKNYEKEQELNEYNEIKSILKEIKAEQTRKTDNSETAHLFLIQDKNKSKYSFFSRDRAKMYLNDNPDLFLSDMEIEVSQIKNVDLDKLISIVTNK